MGLNKNYFFQLDDDSFAIRDKCLMGFIHNNVFAPNLTDIADCAERFNWAVGCITDCDDTHYIMIDTTKKHPTDPNRLKDYEQEWIELLTIPSPSKYIH